MGVVVMNEIHTRRVIAAWEYSDTVLVIGRVGRRASHPDNARYIGEYAVEMAASYQHHGRLGELDSRGRIREIESLDW